MSEKKRFLYLDYAKGIGILSVILYHTFGTIRISDPSIYKDFVASFMCTICIPVFFFISGMLLYHKKENKITIKVVIHKKARAYLYPYATFSILYFIHEWIRHFFDASVVSTQELKSIILDTLTLRGASVLWFLTALFLGEVFFYFFYKHMNKIVMMILFSILAIVIFYFDHLLYLPFYKENLFTMILGNMVLTIVRGMLTVFYLLLGFFFMEFLEKKKEDTILSFLIGIALLTMDGIFCMKMGSVDYNRMVFGVWYWYLFCSILGSTGVILLCRTIKKCKLLEILGTNSLLLMLTHLDFGILRNGLSLAYAINTHISHFRVPLLYFNIFWFVTICEIIVIFILKKWFKFLY